jgi:hypothetical protein
VPFASVFPRHLANLDGQERLQGLQYICKLTSRLPGHDQAQRGERRRLTEPIIALSAGFVDDDNCDSSRDGIRRRQPGIAVAWHLKTVPPSPISSPPQILAGYAAALR